MKKKLFCLALLALSTGVYAQLGVGVKKPNLSSQLEVSASDKGILIPQVSLKNSTDKSTITNGNINSLLVFNTNRIADIVPGYYYWNLNKWIRIANSTDIERLENSNAANLVIRTDNGELIIEDPEANKISIPLLSINIPTQLINNNDGTYTFTSENETTTTIEVPTDVIKNFEQIISNTDVLNLMVQYLSTTVINGNLSYDGKKFTYKDNNNIIQNFSFEEEVKKSETITTLTPGLKGTYIYKNEKGKEITIDIPTDVIKNFEQIISNTDVLNLMVQYLSTTIINGNVSYDGENFTYKDVNNIIQKINFKALVDLNTNNNLSFKNNVLTSIVNTKSSSVTLTEDNLVSSKNISSTNITIEGGKGATLKDVTLEVTPGEDKQVMITDKGKTAWVNPSTLITADNGISKNNINIELGGTLNKPTTISASTQNTLAISGLEKGAYTDNIIVTDSKSNILKQIKATMPRFFYMPSMAMPIAANHINPSMHGSYKNGVFTIDLYAVYVEQFGGTNKTNSTSNPEKTTSLPILKKDELDYYITYYDNSVYRNVSVNNNGSLVYTISPTADPNFASFMNIIFAIKP